MRLSGRHYKYDGVLDIPEGKVGKFEIKHKVIPAGSPLYTANSRSSAFAGHKRKEIVYDKPVRWHELLEDGRRWMSDYPFEQFQHDDALADMHGAVLVGGLGLGYAATVLARNKNVERVVVVEKAPQVIDLVWGHLPNKLTKPQAAKLRISNEDLFTYLRKLKRATAKEPDAPPPFDNAFYDIWASDGEATFLQMVMPLRKLSLGLVINDPVNWNEDVMRGQLRMALLSRLHLLATEGTEPPLPHMKDEPPLHKPWPSKTMGKEAAPFWNWRVPFFKWLYGSGFACTGETAQAAASFYGSVYGLTGWEVSWERYRKGLR